MPYTDKQRLDYLESQRSKGRGVKIMPKNQDTVRQAIDQTLSRNKVPEELPTDPATPLESLPPISVAIHHQKAG